MKMIKCFHVIPHNKNHTLSGWKICDEFFKQTTKKCKRKGKESAIIYINRQTKNKYISKMVLGGANIFFQIEQNTKFFNSFSVDLKWKQREIPGLEVISCFACISLQKHLCKRHKIFGQKTKLNVFLCLRAWSNGHESFLGNCLGFLLNPDKFCEAPV